MNITTSESCSIVPLSLKSDSCGLLSSLCSTCLESCDKAIIGMFNSFAIDFNALYYLNDYAAFGFNFGGSQYGYTEREIPFNDWTPMLSLLTPNSL